MISAQFLQTLLSSVDIVELIGEHIHLKKEGAHHVGLCPFHSEKSPSFKVTRSKQFFSCFGCLEHGNAIGFVQKHMGSSFVEAVEYLADRQRMDVVYDQAPRNYNANTVSPGVYGTLKTANDFYLKSLRESDVAKSYLKKRGMTGEAALQYEVGFAPDEWSPLLAAFPDYKTNPHLHESGLVIDGGEEKPGVRYDRFRGRITFPLHDNKGRVIAFGGRIISENGTPKYLNSPDSPVFDKSRELYGLHQAQKGVRDNAKVIVTEGYMDVVALAQHGISYAVATMGTATTPCHLHKLLRVTDHVIFCFDGDIAGQRAAWKALMVALPALKDHQRVGFIFLPDKHDPDSFLREKGRAEYDKLITDEIPLSVYFSDKISSGLNLKLPEDVGALIKRAQPLLSSITGVSLRLLMEKSVAAMCGMTVGELSKVLISTPAARQVRAPAVKATITHEFLCCLVSMPSLAGSIPLSCKDDSNEWKMIQSIIDARPAATPSVIQMFAGTSFDRLMFMVQQEIICWEDDLFDVVAHFNWLVVMRERDERKSRFKRLQEKLKANGFLCADEMAEWVDALPRAIHS